MLTLAEAVAAAWNTRCNPWISNTATTTTVEGVDLTSDLGAQATAVVDYPGTSANDALDNQVAGVVRHIIARRYRGGKPKTFMPAVPTNAQADGSHFTDTYVNGLGTAFNNFIGDISTITGAGTDLTNMVNVPYYHGATWVEDMTTGRWRRIPTYRAAPVPDIVTSASVDALMGSQRRRRVGWPP